LLVLVARRARKRPPSSRASSASEVKSRPRNLTQAGPRRRGDGDADRPPRPQQLRPVRHRQAHRGRQGTIQILGRAVGRQHQQHRAVDAGGTRRAPPTWSGILSAPGQPRAGAAPRPKESIWAAPPSLTPAQQKEAIRRRAQGATLDELARSYNVSRATISRLSI
jgi:hypothetical protein